MKSIAEIPLIGLIGTFTIIVGVLVPSTVIKTTIDKEILFTYGYEKAQHGLLTLFYMSDGNENVYEILSKKALFESVACNPRENTADGSNPSCPDGYTCKVTTCVGQSTSSLKRRFDTVMGEDRYCITTEELQSMLPTGYYENAQSSDEILKPSNQILKKLCAINKIQFATDIVLPYNKASLIKLVRIVVE